MDRLEAVTKLQVMTMQNAKLEQRIAELEAGIQAVVDTVRVHSLSRNSVTKASLIALATLVGEKT